MYGMTTLSVMTPGALDWAGCGVYLVRLVLVVYVLAGASGVQGPEYSILGASLATCPRQCASGTRPLGGCRCLACRAPSLPGHVVLAAMPFCWVLPDWAAAGFDVDRVRGLVLALATRPAAHGKLCGTQPGPAGWTQAGAAGAHCHRYVLLAVRPVLAQLVAARLCASRCVA
jgi:hypothetical protein